jgi:hypothetical protein
MDYVEAKTMKKTILLLLIVTTPVHSEEFFDRLFFTTDKRISLDRQRQSNVIQRADAVQEETLTVNGIIKSRSGKIVVWVNGHEQEINASSKTAVIQLDNGTTLPVQVGETVKRSTGDKTDIINNEAMRNK